MINEDDTEEIVNLGSGEITLIHTGIEHAIARNRSQYLNGVIEVDTFEREYDRLIRKQADMTTVKRWRTFGLTPWDAATESGDETVDLGTIEATTEDEAVALWRSRHEYEAGDYDTVFAISSVTTKETP